jgi:MioC protein
MGIFEEKLMPFISSALSLSVGFLSKPGNPEVQSTWKGKIHDYTRAEKEGSYIFEPIEGALKGYMTGRGGRMKCGDLVILPDGCGSSRYQVDQIDYYSNPPDMWIALLRQVNQ